MHYNLRSFLLRIKRGAKHNVQIFCLTRIYTIVDSKEWKWNTLLIMLNYLNVLLKVTISVRMLDASHWGPHLYTETSLRCYCGAPGSSSQSVWLRGCNSGSSQSQRLALDATRPFTPSNCSSQTFEVLPLKNQPSLMLPLGPASNPNFLVWGPPNFLYGGGPSGLLREMKSM